MPRPKKSAKKVISYLSEKAWKNIEGKGEISKLVNLAVEKFGESEPIIDINKCSQYAGLYSKNPSLVGCKDEKGKIMWKPKTDCQACRYYRVNHVIIKNIENLQDEQQKLKQDVTRLKTIKETRLEEISQLETQIKELSTIVDVKGLTDYYEKEMQKLRDEAQYWKEHPTIKTIEKIVEKPIVKENIVEKIIEKPVEVIVEKPIIQDPKLATDLEEAKQLIKILEQGHQEEIEHLKVEIEKEEALRNQDRMKISTILSKLKSIVRDFKQFYPKPEASMYEMGTYLRNVQKTIINLEGYLDTLDFRQST
jgi:hypothetical protein